MIFGCNVQVFSFFLSFFFVKGQGVILFSYINGKHEPNISLLLFYFTNLQKIKQKTKQNYTNVACTSCFWMVEEKDTSSSWWLKMGTSLFYFARL
jgi:hypothetical protein